MLRLSHPRLITNRRVSQVNKKCFGGAVAAAVLTFLSTSANATLIDISGVITEATGSFAVLTPLGTVVAGISDIDEAAVLSGAAGAADVNAVDIGVGSFCFSTGALPMCPSADVYVPITSIDGAALTFMGDVVGGTLDVTAFSPTFGLAIPIMVDFDAGTFFADAGRIGTVTGEIAARVRASEPGPGLLLAIGLLAMVGVRSRRPG